MNLAASKLCGLSRKRSPPSRRRLLTPAEFSDTLLPRDFSGLELQRAGRTHPRSHPGRNSELAGNTDRCPESWGSQANFQAGEAPLSSDDPPRLQAEGRQPVIRWKVFCQAGNAPVTGTLPRQARARSGDPEGLRDTREWRAGGEHELRGWENFASFLLPSSAQHWAG